MKFTKEQQKIIDYMYKSLKASGYDDVSISGIIGNALTESSLNPDSVSKSKTFHGLFLNDKNIRQAVIDKYGDYSVKSLMKYAHDWVTGADWVRLNKYTLTNAGKFKRSGYKDAHEASDAWMRLYERPVIVDKAGNVIGYQNQDDRRANATAMYDYINTNYNNIRTTTTDKGKKITIPITAYQDPPQYESTYQLPKQTNTVYPLNPNDRTVPSLDAWNGVGSPSAGPNMPSLQKSMDERKRMFDLFSDNAIALGKKKTLPNLRNVLDRKMEDYVAGIIGVPDVYEEPGYTYTPMMYSPMPVFADGKPVEDLSPLFSPRSNPDAKWHQNWLNNRTKQLQDNYSINPDKFDKYGTGTAEGLLKNLKEAKEYNGASDVNKEYGYDFGVGAVGHVSSGDIGGVAITGEGNKNNIIMYPSYNVDPKYNPNFINDDTQLVVPMTEEEIKKWNEKIISRTRPLQERLSTYIHERTHALSSPLKNSEIFGTLPQSYKIDLINRKHGLKSTTSHNEREMSPEEYRMVPDEIYAGLNEARYKLNLSPDHVVTKEEVRKWKKEGLLNQYLNDKPDDVLVEYFNEVASNTNLLFDPNNMLKAFGNTDSKIIYAKDGKLPKFADGKSPIRIKPANRGKLTRLKKRTGKSEAELYKTGGPAVRKMITFARNARKWKH